MKTLKVTIHNRQHIPFLNRLGPITYPIAISETLYSDLKALGFDVRVVEEIVYEQKVDEAQFSDEADPALLAQQENHHPVVIEGGEGDEEADLDGYVDETPAATEEITLLSKAELDKMEAGEIRDYLEQFTDILTPNELDVVKNAHKKKLVELGVKLYKKVNNAE